MLSDRFFLFTGIAILLACADRGDELVLECNLVVVDSIGVLESDDNYMLVWPVDARFSPDGNIAVVDMMKNTVLFYNSEGEFMRSVGEEGEGPGRFRTPVLIRFASDGSFIVDCENGISCFGSDYEFDHRMQWPRYRPRPIELLDDGGFIGLQQDVEGYEQGYSCTYDVGRWYGEEEPSIICYSGEYTVPMPDESGTMDQSERRGQIFFACASRDGRVFFAPGTPESFEILGFEPNGRQFFHVEDPDYQPVRKTEEEIQEQIDDWESTSNRLGEGSDGLSIRPDPFKPSITGLGIDDQERLWVRLGYYPGTVFRVYDMNGDVLFHAGIAGHDPGYLDWAINIDENGILAFPRNPEDYSRVYILELVEAE
jgi:hypothetical protein